MTLVGLGLFVRFGEGRSNIAQETAPVIENVYKFRVFLNSLIILQL